VPPIVQPLPTWMDQSLGVWNLSGNRVTGEILFIITSKFDPSWYGINLRSLLEVRTADGVLLFNKENNLAFTETERDERILFDESAWGQSELHFKSFVWSESGASAFSAIKKFAVAIDEPPIVPPDEPQPMDKFGNFVKALPFFGIGALFLNAGLRNKRIGKK